MREIKQVGVFYHYVAHYRGPVFSELMKCENFKFNIYADIKANLPALKTIGTEMKFGLNIIRNYWFGKSVLFQPEIIKNAFFGEEKILIYLGNMWFISTWIAAVIARLKGKKILMWTHGVYGKERGIKGFLRLRFYNLSDGLLLYGHNALNLLAVCGFPKDKMHVIYNSLDFKAQKEIADVITEKSRKDMRSSLFINHDLPILLTLGRMTKRINYPLLIKIAKILHDTDFPVNLLLVGDGPERKRVEELVKEYNLDEYVNFYGACYDEKILGRLINSADITIGPGSMGLACIHSLVYGTPVFTHDGRSGRQGPEIEAIKIGLNGGFFNKNDVMDCAYKLKKWLLENTDRKQVEKRCQKSLLPYYTPEYQKLKIVKAILSLDG